MLLEWKRKLFLAWQSSHFISYDGKRFRNLLAKAHVELVSFTPCTAAAANRLKIIETQIERFGCVYHNCEAKTHTAALQVAHHAIDWGRLIRCDQGGLRRPFE
jgi:hypothetical protein